MNITFNISKSKNIIQGELVYNREEHFDYVGIPPSSKKQFYVGGIAILSVNYLQLEVSLMDNTLGYIWGFAPSIEWEEKELEPIVNSVQKVVSVDSELTKQSGIGYKIFSAGKVPYHFDKAKGLVSLGDYTEADTIYEFAQNCYIVLKDDGSCKALILRPKFGD